jgi:hypothetical protein
MAQRGPPSPRGRRLYLKTIGAVGEKAHGSFVFRTAPRQRTKTQTDAQRYATATLAIANRLLSTTTAWEREQAQEIAGNSGFTWKDVMIANFYGTSSEFVDENGVHWYGRRILAKEIQTLLDSISSTEGSVLVRTANGWAALYGGGDGKVLTINPTNHLPDWIMPDPGIGSGAGALGCTNFDTSSSSNQGAPLLIAATGVVPKGFAAKSIQIGCHDIAPTCTITPFIYEITDATHAVLLATGPTVTALHYGIVDCPLDNVLDFAVAKFCAYGICITTGSFNMLITGPTRNIFKGGLSLPTSTLTGWSTSQATANSIWLAGGTTNMGPKGDDGADGTDGTNGLDGTNGTNGLDGDTGPVGPGVATGGATGQALVKASATNYDTAWATVSKRETLTAARTYYVRTDGSDSHDGSANTSGAAFLTAQHAIDVAFNSIDLFGHDIDIQFASGTYGAVAIATAQVGRGSITLRGDATTPSNVVLTSSSTNAVEATNGATLHIKDLQITTTGSGGNGIHAANGAQIYFQNLDFGACAGRQVSADNCGTITCTGNYKISGGADTHFRAWGSGIITVQSKTVTITGTPAFSRVFAWCQYVGLLAVNNITFSGSATGARYSVESNAVVIALGGANYFPGNSAGSTATGGQYF